MACSRALLRVRQRKLCISNGSHVTVAKRLPLLEPLRSSAKAATERERLLMTKEKSFELDK